MTQKSRQTIAVMAALQLLVCELNTFEPALCGVLPDWAARGQLPLEERLLAREGSSRV